MAGIEDQFETVDGSRPTAVPLSDALAKQLPLAAFSLLATGDAFDAGAGRPPPDGPAKARAYVAAKLVIRAHRPSPEHVRRVTSDAERQLAGNPQLVARLQAARPIEVDLVPPGKSIASFGYPKAVARHAAGLFWDDPSWPHARIALRQELLDQTPQLVVHELAHAIHYLAFTAAERELIYRLLLGTFRSRAAVDEVFAIYSEREFLEAFSDRDQRAPGVYGVARKLWSEDQVFTRFVRHLYFPHKKLAGPSAPATGWDRFR